MLTIGLTGGIGSGKTAASDHFASLGITIVDADVVARQVVEPEQPALTRIAEHFGSEILLESGALNRAKLREIIFSTPDEKVWLESLLHPLIREEIIQQLTTRSDDENTEEHYRVLVSPLLFETNQHELVDRCLLIDVSPEVQIQRTIARDNVPEAQVRAILENQASRKSRIEKADERILNDGSLSELYKEVEKMHEYYLAIANQGLSKS